MSLVKTGEWMTYLCMGGRKILHIFSTFFIQSREKVQYKRCPQKFNVRWQVACKSLQTAILYLGVCMIFCLYFPHLLPDLYKIQCMGSAYNATGHL